MAGEILGRGEAPRRRGFGVIPELLEDFAGRDLQLAIAGGELVEPGLSTGDPRPPLEMAPAVSSEPIIRTGPTGPIAVAPTAEPRIIPIGTLHGVMTTYHTTTRAGGGGGGGGAGGGDRWSYFSRLR